MEFASEAFSLRKFLSIGDFEHDTVFASLLTKTAKRGLAIAGVLGAVAVLGFTLSHIFLFGKQVVWTYESSNPLAHMVLLDKAFIFVLGLAAVGFSRTNLTLNQTRWLAAVLICFISVAIVLDDVLGRDVSFSPAYLVLVLVLGVGAVPFKAYQALLLIFAVSVSFFVVAAYLPVLIGITPVRVFAGHGVFLLLFAVLLTGISSFMYTSRYEQYNAARKVEQLKEALEERAAALEAARARSEDQALQLQRLERARENFFANVSHELRTPLTLILGPISDAWHGAAEGNGSLSSADLKMIYRNGVRLQHQINQLLDLSKVGSDEFTLHVREVDVAELVRDVTDSFAPLAGRRDIRLETACTDAGCRAFVNADLMEKVMLNLLSNAVKYTDAGGMVRVSVGRAEREADGEINVTVRDTGIGIPTEELAQVFDRFHQVAGVGRGTFGSTGIGLALCKEIVELHGGTIRAESEPGFGSCFQVTLRQGTSHFGDGVAVDDDDAAGAHFFDTDHRDRRAAHIQDLLPPDGEPELYEVPASHPDAPTILIVEDHADLRSYLRKQLAPTYRIEEAVDGREGLEKARSLLPDLIICDLMMPEINGLDLCRAVKTGEKTNHIPVVILTARADEVTRLEGLETGADDFMSKPFNAVELATRVENLIELRRILRERYSGSMEIAASRISVSSFEARFLEQVRETIERHLGHTNFGVDWLADEVGISARQLQRRLRNTLRLSAAGYIRMIRLQRAAQLLEQHAGTVSEIAYQVGFQDTTHFSKLFKQTYGMVPSEYRSARGEAAV